MRERREDGKEQEKEKAKEETTRVRRRRRRRLCLARHKGMVIVVVSVRERAEAKVTIVNIVLPNDEVEPRVKLAAPAPVVRTEGGTGVSIVRPRIRNGYGEY